MIHNKSLTPKNNHIEYKVTYYTLPVKKELFANYELFNFKANMQKLYDEIEEMENSIAENAKVHCYLIDGVERIMSIAESQQYQMENKYPGKNPNFVLQKFFSVKNRNIEYLQHLETKLTLNPYDNSYKSQTSIRRLITLLKYKEELDKTYFTNNEIDSLNQHLNDNAKDGWKLTNIQPINVNMNSYSYISSEAGATESVAQIQEGFVVFWERE